MAADIDLNRLQAHGWLAAVDYHQSLSSTNDQARFLAEQPASRLPILVIAEQQTAGRGRGSNLWWTGQGSVACSLLLDPAALSIQRRHGAMISLAAAVAIVETLATRLPGLPLGLHWPNDVFAGGRKLAGILVEALPAGQHIIGMGINVNNSLATAPEELSQIATTAADLAGQTFDRTELLLELLDRLQVSLQMLAEAPEQLARRADELCLQHGRGLTIDAGGTMTSGWCAGIDADGALLLDTPQGRQKFYSGVLVH